MLTTSMGSLHQLQQDLDLPFLWPFETQSRRARGRLLASGANGRTVMTSSESCGRGRGGWLWGLESFPGSRASLFRSSVKNTSGKSYTDDETIKVYFFLFSKTKFPNSSSHININPTWRGKTKDLCCEEARAAGRAHSWQEVYSKE